jgi:glycine betaine/choline ABC-type transport system substrate-binding protein
MKNKYYQAGLALIFLLAVLVPATQACVGRILYIGAQDNQESRLMAEMLVTLISERTGTSVKIRLVDNRDELYKAFNSHEEDVRIDIIVENTAAAMAHLQKERLTDPELEFAEVKKIYEQDLQLIWLSPFGFRQPRGEAAAALSAPLLRQDVLTNFPLLPRILNKLSGAIDDQTYKTLLDKVRGGGKPKNVAKDFLRDRKFI